MRKTVAVLFILLTVAAFVQADGQNETDSTQKIIVSGTGDSTELMRALADAFMQKHKGKYTVEVPDAIGSTAGVKALAKGKTDIARIARPLKKQEKKLGINYEIFAHTPVTFVVNPSVKGIDNITTEQIVAIYSGKITDWKDVGATPGKIYPLTREPGDSALKVLSKTFPEFTNISNPVAKVMFLTPEAVATTLKYKNTICFIPYSSVVGTDLKVLKVNGIEPSAEKVNAGQYKHVIPLGVAYKGQPRGLVKKFIDFLYTEEARKIIKKIGAVPVKVKSS